MTDLRRNSSLSARLEMCIIKFLCCIMILLGSSETNKWF